VRGVQMKKTKSFHGEHGDHQGKATSDNADSQLVSNLSVLRALRGDLPLYSLLTPCSPRPRGNLSSSSSCLNK
jgi:hypothetical protein